MSSFGKSVFISSICLLTSVSTAFAGEVCDFGRCFSGLSASDQDRVLSGEKVLLTEHDAAGFEILYGYARVQGASPELALAVFTEFAGHVTELKIVRRADVIARAPGRVVVSYELKVGDVAGGLAKLAPKSEYVLNEDIRYDDQSGRYWVKWMIDSPRTDKFYKGFSFTGHLGQPQHIDGYFVAERIPGTNDVVISYASHIVLKNKMAQTMALDPRGDVVRSTRAAHLETLRRVARWIEDVATDSSDETRRRYLDGLAAKQPVCEEFLRR